MFSAIPCVAVLACNTARVTGKIRANFAEGADNSLALFAQHATAAMRRRQDVRAEMCVIDHSLIRLHRCHLVNDRPIS